MRARRIMLERLSGTAGLLVVGATLVGPGLAAAAEVAASDSAADVALPLKLSRKLLREDARHLRTGAPLHLREAPRSRLDRGATGKAALRAAMSLGEWGQEPSAALAPGVPLQPGGGQPDIVDSGDPQAPLLREALAARQAGQYALARDKFNAVLAADPNRPDVLHQLGLNDAYDKAYPAALDHLAAAQSLAPGDVDITLDRARVLSWNNRIPEAATLVDGVLAAHPDNAEAWDLRSRLHWYQSQPVDAEAAARKAVALDPLSTDFKLMLAQSLAAQGRYPEAADLAREIAPQRPKDPDVAALLQAETDNRPRPWRVDLALAHSSFERIPMQDWNGISVQLNRQISEADTVYGRVDGANRYSQTDTSLTVGDAHVFRPGFGGYAEATVTPSATYFPKWRLAGGAELRVRDDQAPVGATFLSLDGSIAHYNSGTSYGLTPGVIQYLDGGRAWVTLYLSNTIDAQSHYLNGWGVRGDLLVGTDWNVHAGYSRAPESDYEITGGVISVVRDFTLGASWQATPDLSLRLDWLHEDRANSYIRQEVVLGGSYRF